MARSDTFSGVKRWNPDLGREFGEAGVGISVTVVPEPATFAMLGVGVLGILSRKRLRNI